MVVLFGLMGVSDVSARPKVMLFAPGGFLERQPIGYAKRALRDAGYKPLAARYPTHDLVGADRYAQRFALQHPRARIAVGFSAGGTLAANLAARGLVDRAVTVSAIGDLARWCGDGPEARRYFEGELGATMADRRRLSPNRLFRKYGPHRKMLIIHSPADWFVPFGQAERMAELSGGRLRAVTGGHGVFEQQMPRILRYLGR